MFNFAMIKGGFYLDMLQQFLLSSPNLYADKIELFLSLVVIAISFIYVFYKFHNILDKYYSILSRFFIFVILCVPDIVIMVEYKTYFLPLFLMFVIYLFVLFIIHKHTKHAGYLPTHVLVFLNLVANSFIIYALVPIIWVVFVNIAMPDYWLNIVTGLLILIGLFTIIAEVFKLKKQGHKKTEILHFLIGALTLCFIALIKFITENFLYFNVYIWYLYSILVVAFIEFATNYPSLQKTGHIRGLKRLMWIIVILIGGMVVL